MVNFFAIVPETETMWSPPGFSICDPGGAVAARTSAVALFDSQAHVCVKTGSVQFVPIDHNPSYDGVGERCDGFLYDETRTSLIFVELKDRMADDGINELAWQAKAIDQLANTIKYFKQCNPTEDANAEHKEAVIANKQCPYNVGSSIASAQARFFMSPETCGYVLRKTNDISMP